MGGSGEVSSKNDQACGLAEGMEIGSVSDAYNYQKIMGLFGCQFEMVKAEDGSEIRQDRLDLRVCFGNYSCCQETT